MGSLATRMEERHMTDIVIRFANDFAKNPGGRYKKDGSFSGEEFREGWLVPKINQAIANAGRVIVELDGTFGYAASFLDEAFGGLIREGHFSRDVLARVLQIRASALHVQLYKELAEQYMDEATRQVPMKTSA